MKLILLTNDDCFEINDVILKDGIIPCLSGISYSGKEGSAEMMEPAIWFKVLIMNTLSIDCKKQVVQWSSAKALESEQISSVESAGITNIITNVVSLNEDCIDFVNSLDEVFDTIPSLLSSYRSGKLAQDNFYRFLIQLLHVNVLPNVKLTHENLELVNLAIEKYNKILNDLDEAIAKKTNMLLELKKTKFRERRKFAEILIESKKPLHFDDLFIQILEVDLKADLKKFDIDLENIPKQFLPALHEDGPLEAAMIKSALEKLCKMKNRSRLSWIYGSSSKREEHQLQMMYIKMAETENKMRISITKLLDNKMMLRSIIETMKSVVEELKEGLDSFGVELNTKSLIDTTSIISESLSTKSWVSLPKHMFNLFSNTSHPITREHLEGTHRVRAIINAILDEYGLQHAHEFTFRQNKNSSSPQLDSKKKTHSSVDEIVELYDFRKSKSCSNVSSMLSDIVLSDTVLSDKVLSIQKNSDHLSRPSYVIQPSNLPPSGFVFVMNSSPDFICKSIEKLKKVIFDHFGSICKKIHDEIHESYINVNYKKVWVIYENYFYEHTIDDLLNVYHLEYSGRVKVLTKSVEFFTLDDLDLSDSLMSKLLLGPFIDSLSCSVHSVAPSLGKLSFNQFIKASQESLQHSSSDEDISGIFISSESCGSASPFFENSGNVKFMRDKNADASHIDSLLSSRAEVLSVQLKKCILSRFSKCYQNIFDALKAKTPKTKAHHLLRCLRNMTWQIEAIYKEIWKKKINLCSDDVMDALIIILCNLHNHEALKSLYVQVQFLNQVLAQFFYNGEYHFALVQFVGVFQYLHDKAFMKKNRVTSVNGS